MYKQNNEADKTPTCFGSTEWFDRNSPECVGGHDPAHFNQNGSSPHFNTQVRDACDYVQGCSARVQAIQQRLIPTSQLLRNPAQPQTQTPPSPWATKFNTPQQQAPAQAWRPQQPVHQQPHPGMQMMAVNFGIPQYLSVREPQTGGNYGRRLATESFRSMMKSIGHTFAHFFDVEILDGGRGGNNGQGG